MYSRAWPHSLTCNQSKSSLTHLPIIAYNALALQVYLHAQEHILKYVAVENQRIPTTAESSMQGSSSITIPWKSYPSRAKQPLNIGRLHARTYQYLCNICMCDLNGRIASIPFYRHRTLHAIADTAVWAVAEALLPRSARLLPTMPGPAFFSLGKQPGS